MLVRALADAARYDAEAEPLWREFNEPVIVRFASKIERELRRRGAGELASSAEAVARVLVGMNLYAFFDRVVGQPDADLDAVIEPLYGVWMRALDPRP
jgi:hypothetical protein